MNLREAILKEHSKTQAKKIVEWIGNDQEKLEELMNLFLSAEYRIVQRSAWIVSMVAENHPALLHPYLEKMVERMNDDKLPVAVKRNVLRILQYMHLPKHLHGTVMDMGFQFLADPKEAIAVRVFSMTVLANLAEIYPEIKTELQVVIENELLHEPAAAFKSRARRVLKQLGKKQKSRIIYL